MRHHYVPQFLLRNWAEGSHDGKLEVFRLDLPGAPSSRRGAKHTGYEVDLYALSTDEIAGMKKQAVEKVFLQRVDDRAALVHAKLLLKGGLNSLTLEERRDWVMFLMSLRLRQPDIVHYLKAEAERVLRENLSERPQEYEELRGTNDAMTLEEWTEGKYPGLIENFGLSFFADLVNHQHIGTKLLRMQWWIVDCQDALHELLRADHPCLFTAGLESPELVIALPLSPKRVFLSTADERVAAQITGQPARNLVIGLNEWSIAQARVRIYARNNMPARFVRNRRARRIASLPK